MTLYFISWIEAKYRPSTHQELHYLNFDLTNWAHENGNISKTISAMRSAKVAKWPQRHPLRYLLRKVERVLFHPLSSRFLKENQFWRGSCDETHVTIGPKGALGSQKHVEEVSEVSEEIWRFLKKFRAASSFKSASCNHSVSNLATRWRSSTPNSCKTLLVSTWTKVLEVCRYKYLLSNLSWYV